MSIELILAGVIAAFTFWILLAKWGLKKAHGYDIPLDIGFTAFLIWAFNGTYSGMIAACVAGLIFSLLLWIGRRWKGAEHLEWDGEVRRFVWRGDVP